MENDKLPIYYASIDEESKGLQLKEQGVQNIALVDSPAMLTEWLMFEEIKKQNLNFALSEEQRIITAPVIIADLPIYRKDEAGKEYYVVYKKPVIMQMAQKYGSENRNKLVKLTHESLLMAKDVFVFESFVSDESRGIAQPKGFDLPDGTWFVSMKINNNDIWNMAKQGKINGISLEGLFDLEIDTNLTDIEVQSIIQSVIS